jgi:hypothetical protein
VSHPSFRELDELVLHLKGVVLVRDLRRRSGADPNELDMYGSELDRTRGELARVLGLDDARPRAA